MSKGSFVSALSERVSSSSSVSPDNHEGRCSRELSSKVDKQDFLQVLKDSGIEKMEGD